MCRQPCKRPLWNRSAPSDGKTPERRRHVVEDFGSGGRGVNLDESLHVLDGSVFHGMDRYCFQSWWQEQCKGLGERGRVTAGWKDSVAGNDPSSYLRGQETNQLWPQR